MNDKLYRQIPKSLSKGLKIALVGLLLTSCGVTKPRYIDVEREIVTYKDSTILNVKDSIVLIPVEKIVDIVPVYDTLKMETSLAKATAYVDTNYHIIRGSLRNKPEMAKEWHIQYVDRIVEKTDTVYVEKTKEIPVEKKVPYRGKDYWFLLTYCISTILILIILLLKKLRIL